VRDVLGGLFNSLRDTAHLSHNAGGLRDE